MHLSVWRLTRHSPRRGETAPLLVSADAAACARLQRADLRRTRRRRRARARHAAARGSQRALALAG